MLLINLNNNISLTSTEIQSLTSTQIQSLTSMQIQSLTSTIVYITSKQMQSFTTLQMQSFTTLQIQSLTSIQIQSLTTLQIQSLTSTQIKSLTSKQIPSFTSKQIQSFTTTEIQLLTTLQIQSLIIQTLTSKQIQSLITTQIQSLTITQIQSLTMQLLTNDQIQSLIIQSLTTTQLQSLTNTQIQTLTTEQIQTLTTQLQFLTLSQNQSLTTLQIQSLTSIQIQSLTVIQIQVLSNSLLSTQIQQLIITQIPVLLQTALTTTSLQTLIQTLTSTQINSVIQTLSTTELQLLTTIQIQSLTIQSLTTIQIQSLTTIQIQTLTTLQIQTITTTQLLVFSSSKLEALTSAQIQSLSQENLKLIPISLLDALNYSGSTLINWSNTQNILYFTNNSPNIMYNVSIFSNYYTQYGDTIPILYPNKTVAIQINPLQPVIYSSVFGPPSTVYPTISKDITITSLPLCITIYFSLTYTVIKPNPLTLPFFTVFFTNNSLYSTLTVISQVFTSLTQVSNGNKLAWDTSITEPNGTHYLDIYGNQLFTSPIGDNKYYVCLVNPTNISSIAKYPPLLTYTTFSNVSQLNFIMYGTDYYYIANDISPASIKGIDLNYSYSTNSGNSLYTNSITNYYTNFLTCELNNPSTIYSSWLGIPSSTSNSNNVIIYCNTNYGPFYNITTKSTNCNITLNSKQTLISNSYIGFSVNNNVSDITFNMNTTNYSNPSGSGYTSAPTITISGGGGSGATASCAIENRQISYIVLLSGGSGYTSTPTVTISGGGGSGGSAVATIYNGSVVQIGLNTINNFPVKFSPDGIGIINLKYALQKISSVSQTLVSTYVYPVTYTPIVITTPVSINSTISCSIPDPNVIPFAISFRNPIPNDAFASNAFTEVFILNKFYTVSNQPYSRDTWLLQLVTLGRYVPNVTNYSISGFNILNINFFSNFNSINTVRGTFYDCTDSYGNIFHMLASSNMFGNDQDYNNYKIFIGQYIYNLNNTTFGIVTTGNYDVTELNLKYIPTVGSYSINKNYIIKSLINSNPTLITNYYVSSYDTITSGSSNIIIYSNDIVKLSNYVGYTITGNGIPPNTTIQSFSNFNNGSSATVKISNPTISIIQPFSTGCTYITNYNKINNVYFNPGSKEIIITINDTDQTIINKLNLKGKPITGTLINQNTIITNSVTNGNSITITISIPTIIKQNPSGGNSVYLPACSCTIDDTGISVYPYPLNNNLIDGYTLNSTNSNVQLYAKVTFSNTSSNIPCYITGVYNNGLFITLSNTKTENVTINTSYTSYITISNLFIISPTSNITFNTSTPAPTQDSVGDITMGMAYDNGYSYKILQTISTVNNINSIGQYIINNNMIYKVIPNNYSDISFTLYLSGSNPNVLPTVTTDLSGVVTVTNSNLVSVSYTSIDYTPINNLLSFYTNCPSSTSLQYSANFPISNWLGTNYGNLTNNFNIVMINTSIYTMTNISYTTNTYGTLFSNLTLLSGAYYIVPVTILNTNPTITFTINGSSCVTTLNIFNVTNTDTYITCNNSTYINALTFYTGYPIPSVIPLQDGTSFTMPTPSINQIDIPYPFVFVTSNFTLSSISSINSLTNISILFDGSYIFTSSSSNSTNISISTCTNYIYSNGNWDTSTLNPYTYTSSTPTTNTPSYSIYPNITLTYMSQNNPVTYSFSKNNNDTMVYSNSSYVAYFQNVTINLICSDYSNTFTFLTGNRTIYICNLNTIATSGLNVLSGNCGLPASGNGIYNSISMSAIANYYIFAFTYTNNTSTLFYSTSKSSNNLSFSPLAVANGLPSLTTSTNYWSSVCMSADGKYILAGCSNGSLYLSTNGTSGLSTIRFNTISSLPNNKNWVNGCLAMSSSGTYMYATDQTKLYYSNNNGTTWNNVSLPFDTSATIIANISLSGDGSYLILSNTATNSNTILYTYALFTIKLDTKITSVNTGPSITSSINIPSSLPTSTINNYSINNLANINYTIIPSSTSTDNTGFIIYNDKTRNLSISILFDINITNVCGFIFNTYSVEGTSLSTIPLTIPSDKIPYSTTSITNLQTTISGSNVKYSLNDYRINNFAILKPRSIQYLRINYSVVPSLYIFESYNIIINLYRSVPSPNFISNGIQISNG